MLANEYKQHQSRAEAQRQRHAAMYQDTQRALEKLADGVADTMSVSTTATFNKQKLVQESVEKVTNSQLEFKRQRDRWVKLATKHREALKYLGDLQTYTRAIARDLDNICKTVEEVDRKGRPKRK